MTTIITMRASEKRQLRVSLGVVSTVSGGYFATPSFTNAAEESARNSRLGV
jgi:hypothetical protein